MSLESNFLRKLQPSGWDRVLHNFVLNDDFKKIMLELQKQAEVKEAPGITPSSNQIFRAFYECPYKDLKVVIIGQDPYPQKDVADGISFSCGNTMKIQPSLRIIFKELVETVFHSNPNGYHHNPDLTPWANQGILMLNTALTTEVGRVGAHYEIWKPFTTYLLTQLGLRNTDIIYVFMGKAAQDWASLVPESNHKLYCYHPASASYNGGEWDSNDMFNRINQILKSNNNLEIKW